MLKAGFKDLIVKNRTTEVIEEDYRRSIEDLGKMILKKQKGIRFSIGEISNWVSKWTLCDLATIELSFIAAKYEEGSEKVYKGLKGINSKDIKRFCEDITEADIYFVSFELERQITQEIQNCVWSKENLEKYRQDMIMIGRLYQEKTIDYAKVLCLLEIVEPPMKKVVCLSLKQMKVWFDKKNNTIEIEQPKVSTNSIIMNDVIHQTRSSFAVDFKSMVEESVVPHIDETAKLPEVMLESFDRLRYSRDLKAFEEAKRYWKDLIGANMRRQEAIGFDEEDGIDVVKEEHKADKERLENMLRLATQHMTSAEVGAHMKYISGTIAGNNRRADGTENKFYLSLCREEFITWLISMGFNEMDFTGFKLLGNKGYKVDDLVYFEQGQANKAILDGTYTGWTTIKEFDGSLYAAISLEESINVPAPDNRILVKANRSMVKKFGVDKIMTEINKGSRVEFFAGAGHFSMDVMDHPEEPFCVKYDFDPVYSKLFKGCTGSIVKTSIVEVKTNTGEVIQDIYVSVDLDTLPMSSPQEGECHDDFAYPIESVESGEIW